MEIFYWILEVLACGMDAWIYIYALNNLVRHTNEKISRNKMGLAALLMISCGMLCNLDIGILSAAMSMFCYLVYLFYGFTALEANKKEVFIISAITHVSIGIISLTCCYIMSMITKCPVEAIVVPVSGMYRVCLLLTGHLTEIFLIVMVVQWYKRSRAFLRLQEWNWLIFEYVIVMILLAVSMLIWINGKDNRMIMRLTFIVDCGLVAIFLITFYMMCKSVDKYKVQTEYEQLMGSISHEQNLLEQRQQEYEQMQVFRHDLKHYLSTAVAMAQKNQSEDLSVYLQEIMHEHVEMGNGYIALDNPIIEAVINTEISKMQQKQIAFEIVLAEGIYYSNATNVGVILSNIIDNAIEAASLCEEAARSIRIVSKQQRGYVVFEISNSIATSVQKSNPMLKTTKKDKSMHGLGLRSVRKMLDEERGMLHQYERNMQYITEIYLPSMPKIG